MVVTYLGSCGLTADGTARNKERHRYQLLPEESKVFRVQLALCVLSGGLLPRCQLSTALIGALPTDLRRSGKEKAVGVWALPMGFFSRGRWWGIFGAGRGCQRAARKRAGSGGWLISSAPGDLQQDLQQDWRCLSSFAVELRYSNGSRSR
jgi:hypothetical protein